MSSKKEILDSLVKEKFVTISGQRYLKFYGIHGINGSTPRPAKSHKISIVRVSDIIAIRHYAVRHFDTRELYRYCTIHTKYGEHNCFDDSETIINLLAEVENIGE